VRENSETVRKEKCMGIIIVTLQTVLERYPGAPPRTAPTNPAVVNLRTDCARIAFHVYVKQLSWVV